jgi:hypothetical protein
MFALSEALLSFVPRGPGLRLATFNSAAIATSDLSFHI